MLYSICSWSSVHTKEKFYCCSAQYNANHLEVGIPHVSQIENPAVKRGGHSAERSFYFHMTACFRACSVRYIPCISIPYKSVLFDNCKYNPSRILSSKQNAVRNTGTPTSSLSIFTPPHKPLIPPTMTKSRPFVVHDLNKVKSSPTQRV